MDMKKRVTRLGRSIGLMPAVPNFCAGSSRLAWCLAPLLTTEFLQTPCHKVSARPIVRKFHNSPTGRWRMGPAGAIVSLHDGLIHETSRHPVRALGYRHFHGRRPGRCRRRKNTVVALQCTWSGSAIPAQQASGRGLGLRCLLVRMRFLLCMGIGRLPEGRLAGPLPQADGQMRPLLPTPMPGLGRPAAFDRIPMGLAGAAIPISVL
jgi:hypothetical protein